MQRSAAYTALAIGAMAAALVSGILPDPWGTVLPLAFVGLLILALYLRFRSQTEAVGGPHSNSPVEAGPGPLAPGADGAHAPAPRGALEGPGSEGDREV